MTSPLKAIIAEIVVLTPPQSGAKSNLSSKLSELDVDQTIFVKEATLSRVLNISQYVSQKTFYKKKFSCSTRPDGILVERIL